MSLTMEQEKKVFRVLWQNEFLRHYTVQDQQEERL